MNKYIVIVIGVIVLIGCGSNSNDNEGITPTVEGYPEIIINGDNPKYRQVGRDYNDEGAMAEDAEDGSLDVSVAGTVDVDTVGTYTITYSAKDSDNHTSTQTRTVIVQDITHNGTTYGVIRSEKTGRVWLDRNLGATEVAENPTEDECYQGAYGGGGCENTIQSHFGDYYQWGRNHDGHQNPMSEMTTEQAEGIDDAGSKFIVGHQDWSSATNRSENWRKTDGSSICPVGFVVPSAEEWKAEILEPESIYDPNNLEPLMDSLKLPYSLMRCSNFSFINEYGREVSYPCYSRGDVYNYNDGQLLYSHGREVLDTAMWTSTTIENSTQSKVLVLSGALNMAAYISGEEYILDVTDSSGFSHRSLGLAVRCIQAR